MFGTRAALVVDLTFLCTLAAPVAFVAAVVAAKKRRLRLHRRIQLGTVGVCVASVLAFEGHLRLTGGSGSMVASAPRGLASVTRALLLVHIGVAVLTYLAWGLLAWRSARRFGTSLPGAFSATHRRLGYAVFAGLLLTAASATGMYVLAFVL